MKKREELKKLSKKQWIMMLLGSLIVILVASGITLKDKTHADGWISKNNQTFYYKNNKKLTGWQIINTNHCYFNDEGVLQIGFATIDGDTYYFDQKGIMLVGWQEIEGHKYYFSENGKMQRGLTLIDGNIYCLCEQGAVVTGQREINGVTYTFNVDGIIELKEDQQSVTLSKDDQGNDILVVVKADGTTEENKVNEDVSISETPSTTNEKTENNINSPKNDQQQSIDSEKPSQQPSEEVVPPDKKEDVPDKEEPSTNGDTNQEVPPPAPDPTPSPEPKPEPEPTPEPVTPVFSVTASEVYQYALNIGINKYGMVVAPSMNLQTAGWNDPFRIYAGYTKETVHQYINDYWESNISDYAEGDPFNIVVTEEADTHGERIICVYWCY